MPPAASGPLLSRRPPRVAGYLSGTARLPRSFARMTFIHPLAPRVYGLKSPGLRGLQNRSEVLLSAMLLFVEALAHLRGDRSEEVEVRRAELIVGTDLDLYRLEVRHRHSG